MKKSVLNVGVNTHKSKREIMKAVAKLEGIDELSIDVEKGTLTVIGEIDPVKVVEQLRKNKKSAEIASVGPPKPAEKEKEKPPTLVPEYYSPPPFPTYLPPYSGNWVTYDWR